MFSHSHTEDHNDEDQTRNYARKAIMTFNIGGLNIAEDLVVGDVFDLPEGREGYVTYTNVIAHVLNLYGFRLPPNSVIISSEGKIAMPWDIVYADVDSDIATLCVVPVESLDTSDLPTHTSISSDGIDYLEDRPNALHSLPDARFSSVYSLRAAHVHSFRGERARRNCVERTFCYNCRQLCR